MGAFSPVDDLPNGLVDEVHDQVILPVLTEMDERGDKYTGFLYAGLVLTEDGPQVLEFNCRLGDPEAQVVLPRLEDDLVGVMLAAIEGACPRPCSGHRRAAVDVVLASAGYPDNPAPAIGSAGPMPPPTSRMSSSSTPRPRATPDGRSPQVAGCSTWSGWAMTWRPPVTRLRGGGTGGIPRDELPNRHRSADLPVTETGTVPAPQQRSVIA